VLFCFSADSEVRCKKKKKTKRAFLTWLPLQCPYSPCFCLPCALCLSVCLCSPFSYRNDATYKGLFSPSHNTYLPNRFHISSMFLPISLSLSLLFSFHFFTLIFPVSFFLILPKVKVKSICLTKYDAKKTLSRA